MLAFFSSDSTIPFSDHDMSQEDHKSRSQSVNLVLGDLAETSPQGAGRRERLRQAECIPAARTDSINTQQLANPRRRHPVHYVVLSESLKLIQYPIKRIVYQRRPGKYYYV